MVLNPNDTEHGADIGSELPVMILESVVHTRRLNSMTVFTVCFSFALVQTNVISNTCLSTTEPGDSTLQQCYIASRAGN